MKITDDIIVFLHTAPVGCHARRKGLCAQQYAVGTDRVDALIELMRVVVSGNVQFIKHIARYSFQCFCAVFSLFEGIKQLGMRRN